MIPEWSSIVDLCKKSEALNDSLSSLPNTICTTISLSDKFLSFKSKGGEYKKVKITCNRDWELLAFPKWVIVSRNNHDEIVVESTKIIPPKKNWRDRGWMFRRSKENNYLAEIALLF